MKFKKLLNRIRALFPSKLPIGVEEFNIWAKSIIDMYGSPDNDSVRFTLAVMILQMSPTAAYKSKEYFGRALHKAMANQIASHMMHEIKTKQAEQEKVVENYKTPGLCVESKTTVTTDVEKNS